MGTGGIRVVLDSLHSVGLAETCRLRLATFGASTSPIGSHAAQIEFFAAASPTARNATFDPAERFATLKVTLDLDVSRPPVLVIDGEVEQGELGKIYETAGHRYPRRAMKLLIDDSLTTEPADERTMLLPDSVQLDRGYLEVTAKLSIGGSLHSDASLNDTFDMVLRPLSATHAILRFVDERRAPHAGVRAVILNAAGEEFEVEADDHGEAYLPAPNRERFRVVRLLPDNSEQRLALNATRLFPNAKSAV